MRRVTWSLPVLAMTLLLLAPAAQACTRLPTDDPDDHARLQVHDVLANRTLATLRLEHRSMDSMCGLANPRDIGGDVVAWSEYHTREPTDETTIRVHHIEDNRTRDAHRFEGRDTEGIAVHAGHVTHVSRVPNGTTDSGETAYRLAVFTIDLDGRDDVHEHDLAPSGDVQVDGRWVAWTEGGTEDDPRTLHLYDAVAGEWADPPRFPWDDPAIRFDDIELPSRAQLTLVGGDWLVFTSRDDVWLHHAVDRTTFDVSDRLERTDRMVLADGYLWWWSQSETRRFAVPHGPTESADPAWDHYWNVVIDDGRALTGEYSTGAPRSLEEMRENETLIDTGEPTDSASDEDAPPETEVVPTEPLLSVLTLLALLAHRRRS